ncbi:small integral membrane protein 20 isoform X1 [Mustela lutreola]|uniref:small integral membrane protein 20 isoform X1 n=1 Tax=Mustela lutreola TaxID=9666 RepID=UPI00279711B8|nr:small integral membrane protein 20 isoform X1 [Mustela lutreola]
MSRNLRTVLIFGGFISLIGAAFYPIYFRPLMRLEEYRIWADQGEGHSSWKCRTSVTGMTRSVLHVTLESKMSPGETVLALVVSKPKPEVWGQFCCAPGRNPREGASHKSSRYYSRKCAAARVKSVV